MTILALLGDCLPLERGPDLCYATERARHTLAVTSPKTPYSSFTEPRSSSAMLGDVTGNQPNRDSGWQSRRIWARSELFGRNAAKQLIVPECRFHEVSGVEDALEVRNSFGCWPAATSERPLANELLWLKLPRGARPGDPVATASWNLPSRLDRFSPERVRQSYIFQ
jgi:hypothetical protein